MYKVFINDKAIYFTNNEENCANFSNGLVLNFFTSSITPFIVDLLFQGSKSELIIIAIDDYETAFNEFQSNFKIIKAAGGIVKNDADESLYIYRLEKWDLPKGKIEKNEEVKEAAIREVEEECGIEDLLITNQLKDTYHIYKHNEQFIFKITYWFDMKSNYNKELIPQLEEGITKVEWLTDELVNEMVLKNTYASIKDLLKE